MQAHANHANMCSSAVLCMTLPPVYPIVDGPLLTARGLRLTLAAESLLEAGMRMLQIRWKDGYSSEVYAEAQAIAEMCRQVGALLVVNDRVDVAGLLGTGVHVGQDDLPVAETRRLIGEAAVLGVSTHNISQLRAALPQRVDYVAFGPVFTTGSKLNPDPVVGVAGVEGASRIARSVNTVPLVAIGGITRESAPSVWRAGADSVAIIGDLYPSDATKASVRARAEEWTKIAHEHRG
jgi:thiamine-phosphate pyrophosphorylase